MLEDEVSSRSIIENEQERGEKAVLVHIRKPSQVHFRRSAAPSPESEPGDAASNFDEAKG